MLLTYKYYHFFNSMTIISTFYGVSFFYIYADLSVSYILFVLNWILCFCRFFSGEMHLQKHGRSGRSKFQCMYVTISNVSSQRNPQWDCGLPFIPKSLNVRQWKTIGRFPRPTPTHIARSAETLVFSNWLLPAIGIPSYRQYKSIIHKQIARRARVKF